jgi:ABC-type multidrug transport system ATPase subunit
MVLILLRILGMITADRYRDAKINDEYEIKLFDSKLGNYVDKKLFSGGTNDQIALAFRLAFAMATMKDDSSRESFIFLDEPIGFFDDERRDSLINFLTSGVISNKFAQRIVISNFLDIEQHFDYIIEIDNGRIINQTITDSLFTKQPLDSYTKPLLEDFLELTTSEHLIEDGFCEDCLTLTNISENYIKSIQLSKSNKNLDIVLVPILLNDLKSGDYKSLNLQYHSNILDEDKIVFDAYIKYLKDDKEENRIQKLEYVPQME